MRSSNAIQRAHIAASKQCNPQTHMFPTSSLLHKANTDNVYNP